MEIKQINYAFCIASMCNIALVLNTHEHSSQKCLIAKSIYFDFLRAELY